MLNYLSSGKRRYIGNRRIFPYRRGFWEFQAVLKGSIGLLEDDNEHPLQRQRLWLLHPDYKHGWHGKMNQEAEVAVFHFAYIPSQLEAMVPETGQLSIELDKSSDRQVRAFLCQAKRALQHPDGSSQLRTQSIQIGLSLLILDHLESNQLTPTANRARSCVNNALAFYRSHLDKSPDLQQVSRECHVSVAHLRRMFNQVTGTSPKEALDQVRFQLAQELLGRHTLTLEQISEKTGFHSASAFSRAFKTRFGLSPNRWRDMHLKL